ncbi:MAG: hypothetical protein DCC50_15055, partial [Acidobacteria bacterium]
FVATAGSAYVQLEEVPATAWWGSLVVGLPTVGVLLANNIRDLWTDAHRHWVEAMPVVRD